MRRGLVQTATAAASYHVRNGEVEATDTPTSPRATPCRALRCVALRRQALKAHHHVMMTLSPPLPGDTALKASQ